MDFATIIGMATAALLMFFAIGPANLAAFVDLPSVYIVLGGSSAATLAAFPASKVLASMGIMKNVFFVNVKSPVEVIKQLVEFAEQARREGILALESRASEIKDDFLKKGLQLAVDGTEPDLIKDILSTDIAFTESRHEEGAKIFDFMGFMAPAFGMMGTSVGLVLMLGNLSDIDSIGPNMAVALITTFYGSVVANMFCIPIVQKLKNYSARELLVKELMLEGIMSLQSGDNPRIVEQKLTSFLEPSLRLSAMKDGKK